MTNLTITMGEDMNRFIDSQGSVESRANQFTTKEETLHPSTNHDYGGR
jgi:hypothetical protein